MSKLNINLLLIPMILFVIGCTDTAQEDRSPDRDSSELLNIEYRADTCSYDDKEIRAKRYGAEIMTDEGEHHKFCSSEHLIAFLDENDDITDENAKIRVVEFADGKTLIHPSETTFLDTPNQPSPGGLNLHPFDSTKEHEISRMQELYTGDLLTWEEAQEHVADEFDL